MVSRPERGYTLMEVTVSMAIFGIFLFIVVSMTSEMRRNEKRWPVNYFANPEAGSVLARMRRDISDSTAILGNYQNYSSSGSTLILYTISQDGTSGETVVWDLTAPGEVHRRGFKATQLSSEWTARGLPIFTFDSESLPSGRDAVRVRAIDKENRLAIDELFVPRPHA